MMGKKKKSTKKSIFLKNIFTLKENIEKGKLNSNLFLYASREQFIKTKFDLVMKKRDINVIKESL